MTCNVAALGEPSNPTDMAETSHSAIDPSAWTSRPTPGLQLSGGTRCFAEPTRAREALGPGLKLALLIEGSFVLGVESHADEIVSAATSNLFVSQGGWQLDHHFPQGTRLRYLTLFLEAALIEDLLEQRLPGLADRNSVLHATRHTPPAMAGIAASILHRPLQGPAGRLHESGKALELAALAIETLAGRPRGQSPLSSATQVERLRQLREYLDMHWQEAAPADVLARQFGFGIRSMTVGFRRLFGCSIIQYLRELRLREAWRLLDSGMSATLVAEQVGYTLPHFTTAFARRFGVTPGSLARRGLG